MKTRLDKLIFERGLAGSIVLIAGVAAAFASGIIFNAGASEILHLARLLARIAEDLPSENVDRYLIRDAQRVIEAIETLVRMHTAQEEDIYEAVAARTAA